MSNELKVNSRVVVARSVIPNATSFIGWQGRVLWIDNRFARVRLDNDPSGTTPVGFLHRELDVLD